MKLNIASGRNLNTGRMAYLYHQSCSSRYYTLRQKDLIIVPIKGVTILEYVIEMLGIRKEFGNFVANNNITLQLKQGEIHALLGENGAGKSTLMNVLFGLYQPEGGEIRVRGKAVKITNPNIANDLGIGMVHQHFMLVENFTVTENIILGTEPTKMGIVNIKDAAKKVQALSEKYGLDVDPYAKIEDITVGMQQRVEILKTLYRGAEILIFDEPTASLTPQEITELIQIMRRLIAEGKSIILITHKLKEIMEVSDRVTIIRKGEGIGTVVTAATNPDQLAEMMVGRQVEFKTEKIDANPTDEVLSINNLVVTDYRNIDKVKGLNLNVRKGEIVGIAGIDGNGQSELIEAITGLRKIKSGTVKLNGKDITNMKPRKITEEGVGHIPQDRHKHGLVLDFPIGHNIALQTYYQSPIAKGFVMDYKKVSEKARQIIQEYDVRTGNGEMTPARALSGGNQQKAIIGREIDRNPDLLIAALPTRGLDVGAIEFIHSRLIEQRDKGKAVLLISFELDEVMNVSDRIAVIYDGQIVDELNPKETTEQELGLLMAGQSKKNNKHDAKEGND